MTLRAIRPKGRRFMRGFANGWPCCEELNIGGACRGDWWGNLLEILR